MQHLQMYTFDCTIYTKYRRNMDTNYKVLKRITLHIYIPVRHYYHTLILNNFQCNLSVPTICCFLQS